MKRIIFVSLFMSIAILISGCGKKEGKVLATIGGNTITLPEFKQKIERMPQQYQELIIGRERQFLDDIIMEELMYKEARKSGFERDKEVREMFAAAKKKILISRLIKVRVDDKASVADEEIKKYYNEHSEEFMLPERWRASHILVETPEEAEDIKKRLEDGETFEELAKKFSMDATARSAGDVGYFSQGQLIPEFESECFKLEVGQISDTVKTQFGYHIIKLTERKSPEVQEYSKVKDIIRAELERKAKRQLLEEMMNDLKNNAKITVNEECLNEMIGVEAGSGTEN